MTTHGIASYFASAAIALLVGGGVAFWLSCRSRCRSTGAVQRGPLR